MDDEELDLDAFIANIEQSAPKEEVRFEHVHVCQDCNVPLEENDDGDFVCPSCSAQATNILQLEATECFQNEFGRDIVGAGVKLFKRPKHNIDYGWAWSTDEAIVHLLSLQIDNLERVGLVPRGIFRDAIKQMWCKYWIKHIAPFIKDRYTVDDFVDMAASKALRSRDIEVLVKVSDKVLVPEKQLKLQSNEPKVNYPSMRLNFSKSKSRLMAQLDADASLNSNSNSNSNSTSTTSTSNSTTSSNMTTTTTTSSSFNSSSTPAPDENSKPSSNHPSKPMDMDPANDCDSQDELSALEPPKSKMKFEDDTASTCTSVDLLSRTEVSLPTDEANSSRTPTTNINMDSIAILTLDRTLAFIEATARCLNLEEPLFSSDIIRACNQRIIPYFGAQKSLPPDWNLNYKDSYIFRKNKPPSAVQLTASASLLIHKLYRDQFPVHMPVPNFDKMIKRFIYDLNLPFELFNHIKEFDMNFSSFKLTKPVKFDTEKRFRKIPQYNRWAFVMLIGVMKRLFGLQDIPTSALPVQEGEDSGTFNIAEWTQQMSIRLQLIMSYDPYLLYHPMTNIRNLQPNPQLWQYMSTVVGDKVIIKTRTEECKVRNDEVYRRELADFCTRHIPRPQSLHGRSVIEEFLDKPVDYKNPIRDSFQRTRRFWIDDIIESRSISRLLFKDFSNSKIVLPTEVQKWSMYDEGIPKKLHNIDILPEWPYCFKLLLSVGAFTCVCEPKDLLKEYRFIEEYLYPDLRVVRKRSARTKKLN